MVFVVTNYHIFVVIEINKVASNEDKSGNEGKVPRHFDVKR